MVQDVVLPSAISLHNSVSMRTLPKYNSNYQTQSKHVPNDPNNSRKNLRDILQVSKSSHLIYNTSTNKYVQDSSLNAAKKEDSRRS